MEQRRLQEDEIWRCSRIVWRHGNQQIGKFIPSQNNLATEPEQRNIESELATRTGHLDDIGTRIWTVERRKSKVLDRKEVEEERSFQAWSSQDKRMKLATTDLRLPTLAKSCDGAHVHQSWTLAKHLRLA